MNLLFYILAAVVFVYAAVLTTVTVGFFRLSVRKKMQGVKMPDVTVAVAVRNEAENIRRLIKSIASQNYNREKLKLIIVDDHSSDNTKEEIAEIIRRENSINIFYYALSENVIGKREALAKAVAESSTELILLTDADCEIHPDWVLSMANGMDSSDADIACATVLLKSESEFVNYVQQLEWLSLAAVTAGSFGINAPVMAGAANMATKKSFYLKAKDYLFMQKNQSGDDMYLLDYAMNNHCRLAFVSENESIVQTKASNTIQSFFNQRMRWASKAGTYKNSWINTFGSIILAGNLVVAFLMLVVLFPGFAEVRQQALILILIKWCIDFLLLFLAAIRFNKKKYMLLSIAGFIVYPFYLIAIVAMANMFKHNWKGRTR